MRLSVVLMLCLLSACMGTKVEIDKNYTFDPSRNQHYAWANEPMVDTSGRQEPMIRSDAILRAEVNRQLQNRGYKEVAKSQADFLVIYHITQSMQTDKGGIISPTDEAAASWDLGDDANNTELYHHSINAYILHSKLQLLLTDSKGKKLWEANASKLLDNEAPSDQALQKSLASITSKMFRGFPRVE